MNINCLLPIFLVSGFTIAMPSNSDKSLQAMLHRAVLNDSAEEIKKAVKLGANVNNGIEGKAPILWALWLKKSNAAEALLDCGAITDKQMIEIALRFNFKIAFLIAIKGGYNLDNYYTSCEKKMRLINFALWNRAFKEVLFLIKAGADFSAEPSCSYYFGCPIGAIIDFVLGAHFCAPCIKNSSDDEKLGYEILQEIINRGVDINTLWFSETDWQMGIAKYGSPNFEKLLKFLIKNGIDPNKTFVARWNSSIWSPLFAAIYSRNLKTVEALLDVGADMNYKTIPYPSSAPVGIKSGHLYTPLSFAIDLGHSEISELLLKRGAKL